MDTPEQVAAPEQTPPVNWDIYGSASAKPAPAPAPPATVPTPAAEKAPAVAAATPAVNWGLHYPATSTNPGAPAVNWNIYGPATSGQSAAPEAPDGEHWWSRSLINTVAGSDVAEGGRQKLSNFLRSKLPESMRGQYLTDFLDETSKAGPGVINFLTSPVGLTLTAAHMFPGSAPFAAAADVILGGQQALQAIPDVIDAATNLRDPRKMARVLVDVAGAYAGLKGGAKINEALKSMPADTGAGLSATGKVGAMAKAYGEAFEKTAPPATTPLSRGADLRAQLDAAAPEDRAAIIQSVEQPASLKAKAEKALYSTPFVRSVTNLLAPGVEKPPLTELGQTLVNDYLGNIAEAQNKVVKFRDWMFHNVPEEDRNVRRMGYAMEGDLPERDLSSPQAAVGLEKMRDMNREKDAMLIESGVDEDSLRDPNTYIRHYYDFNAPGGDKSKILPYSTRMMRDPSIQKRTIGTLKAALTPEAEGGYGLTPKYEDVTDVVSRRFMEATRAVENQRLANKLREYGLLADPTKANMRELNWPRADAPALKRAIFGGKSESGDVILRDAIPLVHPDVQMAVDAIYGEPFKGIGWNAVNQFRAFSKQLAVGFSLFHNGALSEVAQAHAAGAGGLEAVPRVIKAAAWPLDPEFIRGLKAGIWEVRGRKGATPDSPVSARLSADAVSPWLKPGLEFSSSESESAAIQAARDFWKDKGPVLKAVGSPIRAVGDLQYIVNHALFDYYLPGQALHTAEHLYAAEANRLGPNPTPAAEFNLRREISDHVNRTLGAENLQRLLVSPKGQQALGMAFFAPMWTLSILRVLAKGFETTTGSRLTGRYVAGAALTYFATTQLANYAMSSWYGDPNRYGSGGEYWDKDTQQWKRGGHWTWQNPGDPVKIGDRYVPGMSDNAANIYFGQNPDGSQRYLRPGKAFQEPFRWLTHPIEMLGSKLSLPVRAAITQITKSEPGTGFQTINPKLTEDQQNQQRLAAAASVVTPFSAAPLVQKLEHWMSPGVFREPGATSQWMGLPARRGASFNTSVQALREAVQANRPDLIEQVARNAQINGISGIGNEFKNRLRNEQRTALGVIPRTDPPPVK